MVTASPSISPPRPRRSRIRRVVIVLASILLLAMMGAAAWLYSVARSALPQLDGTVKVQGLSASVTVSRDARGVPAIDAANLADLFFAQGYVTAQDRMFEMDGMRRYAAGDLSEIIGDS